MVGFASVMADVAAGRARARERSACDAAAAALAALDLSSRKGDSGQRAFQQREAPPQQDQPDRETLLAAVREASGDARRLSALRRKCAWLLHPDRTGAGAALLAEINGAIDAALQRLRKA